MSSSLWPSEEWRRRQSEVHRGKPRPHCGVPRSEETKQRISKANLGHPGYWTGRRRSEEARREMSKSHCGERNGNWQGGISFEPYTPDFNNHLKRSIRERDNHTCQICGVLEIGRVFPVHHIDYDKTNCDQTNLVTLCPDCHNRTNPKEQRIFWMARLRQTVSETVLLTSGRGASKIEARIQDECEK